MEVTVVDASAAAAPRRQPRRRMDWRDHFANMRARDVKRTEELESRLRQVRLGTYRVQSWASRPAALAFQVILNGRELGRIGVGDPGSVSVTVCAKRHHDERIAFLSAHGGDFVGPQTWRWFQWPWAERRLETGDRVRIEVVPPLGLSRNRLRELQTNDLTSAAAISRELKELRRRLKSDRHREEAAGMIQSERERLPPRRYPRG